MTCKNCFHYNACKSLLESMGCIVDGDGIDAEKKCAEFEIKTDRTAPKSGPLQRLIKNLYAYRISTPATMYHPEICTEAAQVIENLLQELEDERYRHDRLQDWTVARDEEREKLYPELGREVFFVLDDPDEEIGKRWKVEEGMRVVAVAENRIGVSDIEDPESISFFWYDPFDKTEEAFFSRHAAEIRAKELNQRDLETLDFLRKGKENAEL